MFILKKAKGQIFEEKDHKQISDLEVAGPENEMSAFRNEDIPGVELKF